MKKSLRQQWIDITKLYSIDNDMMSEILFHVFIGQYFKNVKIGYGAEHKDLRISSLLVSPSRSGKGQAMKVFKKMCEMCGINAVKNTIITTAGLVGQVDNEKVKFNIHNNLSEGEVKEVQRKGKIKVLEWQNPVVPGDLSTSDVIIFDEASALLKPGKFTADMLSVLQEALDYPGTVRKKLASQYPIEFTSTSSIVGTTYIIGEIKSVLLSQGFFQRILVYIRQLPFNKKQKMRRHVLQLYQRKNLHDKDKVNKMFEDFIVDLNKLDNSDRTIYVSNEALDVIDKNLIQFEKTIESDFSGNELELLTTFVTGMQELYIKLSAHYAIMHNSNIIKANHVSGCKSIIRECIFSLTTELMELIKTDKKNVVVDKIQKMILDTVQNNAFTKEDLILYLIKKGVPARKLRNQVNILIRRNEIRLNSKKKHLVTVG